MKQPVITVKQPHASLIIENIKPIENRTWKCPTKYIGKRVLIHAGMDNLLKKVRYGDVIPFLTNEQLSDATRTYERTVAIFGTYLPTGAIIGSVEIVDCVINHTSIWAEPEYDTICEVGGCHSPTCDGCDKLKTIKTYNWVLANPIKFPEPIPCKGKLSFWDYPNILAEPEEENGKLFCHCNLPVKLENQVMSMGGGELRCRYCGGKWYR